MKFFTFITVSHMLSAFVGLLVGTLLSPYALYYGKWVLSLFS